MAVVMAVVSLLSTAPSPYKIHRAPLSSPSPVQAFPHRYLARACSLFAGDRALSSAPNPSHLAPSSLSQCSTSRRPRLRLFAGPSTALQCSDRPWNSPEFVLAAHATLRLDLAPVSLLAGDVPVPARRTTPSCRRSSLPAQERELKVEDNPQPVNVFSKSCLNYFIDLMNYCVMLMRFGDSRV
jgi:hypothetical protein